MTPAYGNCPQGRAGNEATQAMLISGDNRMSRIMSCVEAAGAFQLSREAALSVAKAQVEVILAGYDAVCAEAGLSDVDCSLM